MTFEKGLDPVKVQHFVRPDLDHNLDNTVGIPGRSF